MAQSFKKSSLSLSRCQIQEVDLCPLPFRTHNGRPSACPAAWWRLLEWLSDQVVTLAHKEAGCLQPVILSPHSAAQTVPANSRLCEFKLAKVLTARSCLQLCLKFTTRGSPAAFVPYCPTPALWPKRKHQRYLAGTSHKQVAICLLASYQTHCVLTKVLSDRRTDRLYVISHRFCIYSNIHTVIKIIKRPREEK